MSQEINLLNPALRRKRDWLAFDLVAGGAALALFCIVAVYAYAALQSHAVQQRYAVVADELRLGQSELQSATAQMAERRSDPALEQEVVRLRMMVDQRKELLGMANKFASSSKGGVAEVMRGFSRQIVDGVWLTGFVVAPDDFEIRGRLLDSSLLPAYIRRLNSEPALRGRQFVALDMRAVTEEPAVAAPGTVADKPKPAARYTEFVLRASAASSNPPGGKP